MRLRSRSGGGRFSRIHLNNLRMFRLIVGNKNSALSFMMRKALMRGGLLRNGFSWSVKEYLILIMPCFSRAHREVHTFQAQKVWSMKRKN